MYNEFFGLERNPFHLTPNPEFLYLTAQHREALAGITYAILARRGFVVLTGEAGTGKTTLLVRILGHLPNDRVRFSVIANPTLTPAEFLEAALMDFGFKDIPASKAQRVGILHEFLWAAFRAGKIAALIIDEAHKLTPELIEEIRLLGNFESADEKLLQIILVGQGELDLLINQESLRQFKQRISLRLTIEPLVESKVAQYIQYRWTKAGGKEAAFSEEAIDSVGKASHGVPRVINVLCDNALMLAFGEQSARVEQRHVLTVCRDLQFSVPPPRLEPVAVAVPVADVRVAEASLAEASVVDALPMMATLARYERTTGPKRSLMGRLAGKLKFMQRTEPA